MNRVDRMALVSCPSPWTKEGEYESPCWSMATVIPFRSDTMKEMASLQ